MYAEDKHSFIYLQMQAQRYKAPSATQRTSMDFHMGCSMCDNGAAVHEIWGGTGRISGANGELRECNILGFEKLIARLMADGEC